MTATPHYYGSHRVSGWRSPRNTWAVPSLVVFLLISIQHVAEVSAVGSSKLHNSRSSQGIAEGRVMRRETLEGSESGSEASDAALAAKENNARAHDKRALLAIDVLSEWKDEQSVQGGSADEEEEEEDDDSSLIKPEDSLDPEGASLIQQAVAGDSDNFENVNSGLVLESPEAALEEEEKFQVDYGDDDDVSSGLAASILQLGSKAVGDDDDEATLAKLHREAEIHPSSILLPYSASAAATSTATSQDMLKGVVATASAIDDTSTTPHAGAGSGGYLPEINITLPSIPEDAEDARSSDSVEALPAPALGPVKGTTDLPSDRDSWHVLTQSLGFTMVAAAGLGIFGFLCLKIFAGKQEAAAAGLSGSPPPAIEGEGEEGSKLPEKVRWAYCLPTISTLPMSALIAVFGLSYYSRRNADLPTMALAIALARSVDVVSDPVMSYLSDSCRHIAGRRKPFILFGAPLYGFFLYCLLNPPWVTSVPLAAWFALMYICFFLMNTFCNVPYDAWGPELSEDSAERTRLFFLSGLMDGCGTVAALAMPFIGFKIAKHWGLTEDICVPTEEVVHKCSVGISCGLYEENGPGYEFAVNVSFAHSFAGYEKELLGYDCDGLSTATPHSIFEMQALSTFCDCVSTCEQACSSANRAWGFAITGGIFGVWYVLTQLANCSIVQERPAPPEGRRAAAPIVPSLLNTMKNPAFSTLLPAWAADAVSAAVFLSLCPYFVMYVIAPEYQSLEDSPFNLDCKEGARAISSSSHYDRRCSTMVVLGAGVMSALVAAAVSTPLWLHAVKKHGKVKTWLFWSLTMAVTNFAFAVLDKAWIRSVVFVCALNGIPIAAKFLADAVLADIIDYDEYLTGTRNEAVYTMFKSFLPKVMAIPAAAIPLSVMNAMGHVPTENGKIQYQPEAVRTSIKVMASLISGLAALFAWWQKRKYPLTSDAMLDKIRSGVAAHKRGEASPDPLTGVEYSVVEFSDEENESGVWDLEHFRGVQVVQAIVDNPTVGLAQLTMRANIEFLGATLFLISSLLGMFFSLPLLWNAEWSVVPTLFAVALGFSFICFGFTFLRLVAVRRMVATPPAKELAEKVLKARLQEKALADARAEMAGLPPPPEEPRSDPSPSPSAPAAQAPVPVAAPPPASGEAPAQAPSDGGRASRRRGAPAAAPAAAEAAAAAPPAPAEAAPASPQPPDSPDSSPAATTTDRASRRQRGGGAAADAATAAAAPPAGPVETTPAVEAPAPAPASATPERTSRRQRGAAAEASAAPTEAEVSSPAQPAAEAESTEAATTTGDRASRRRRGAPSEAAEAPAAPAPAQGPGQLDAEDEW